MWIWIKGTGQEIFLSYLGIGMHFVEYHSSLICYVVMLPMYYCISVYVHWEKPNRVCSLYMLTCLSSWSMTVDNNWNEMFLQQKHKFWSVDTSHTSSIWKETNIITSFKVDTQDYCHQFSVWQIVNNHHSDVFRFFSRVKLLNKRIVFVEYYDVPLLLIAFTRMWWMWGHSDL